MKSKIKLLVAVVVAIIFHETCSFAIIDCVDPPGDIPPTVGWGKSCGAYCECQCPDGLVIQRPTICVLCPGCSNCYNDEDWSAGNTGYQKKVSRACDCDTCNATTAYRCAAGYYGTSTNGTSGCIACPPSGTSSIDDNTTITGCYMSGGGTDDAGIWTFTDACYYNN